MAINRQPWFPGAIYYISSYAKGQEQIFYGAQDYLSYLAALENVRYQYPFYLHSYCLTTTHVHLLVETTHIPMKDIINKLSDLYTQQFNSRYGSSENLLLDQQKARLIVSADSFLKASKYIHLIPIQANVAAPLTAYRWSSYLSFISRVPNDHVVTSRILAYFPNPKMRHYQLFVEAEQNEAQIPKKEAFN